MDVPQKTHEVQFVEVRLQQKMLPANFSLITKPDPVVTLILKSNIEQEQKSNPSKKNYLSWYLTLALAGVSQVITKCSDFTGGCSIVE
ncbi:hypothetical protein RUM44_006008 [Polyplax serrata]|uniref:Uncharacterized protein n=1 Tax=Polyplax serrata TaxID=468196 RepID=A0ABR1B0L2_POLSC